MFQTAVQVHGMASSSAGALVCGAIRRRIPDAKQLVASRTKCTVTFVSETKPDADALREAVDNTGYKFVACETVEYEKRRLFGGKKREKP